jgi:hypothetical protein
MAALPDLKKSGRRSRSGAWRRHRRDAFDDICVNDDINPGEYRRTAEILVPDSVSLW